MILEKPVADGPITDFDTLDAAVQASPFHVWLGVRLKSLGDDGIEITMPWRPEFVSEPSVGYTHGGILGALVDLAGDYAVMAKLGRTLATAEAHVYDERDKLVASGRAVYLTLAR